MGCAISKGKERLSAAAAALWTSEWRSGRDAANSCGDGMGSSRGSFHVFLGLRGPDVRSTFLAHLHHALVREGIRAYVDNDDLRCGDDIASSLKKAIHDSRMAVIIFSENYASSRWCLTELTEIMECRKEDKLVVKPLFYKVEPREVRTPTYSFVEALAAHEFKVGKDSGMVSRWREVLFEGSGWHLDQVCHERNVISRNEERGVGRMGCPISKGKGSVSAAAASSTSECRSRRDPANSSGDGMGSSRGSFHVFLGFRGPDVRSTFLAHLHHALVREGIRAYVDDEDLRCGDDIASSLKKAIHDSRMAVIIFSDNYASSRWCLTELTEIMECWKESKLVVKPVFYRVEPREVRTPRYSFAEALAAHEFKFGKDSSALRRWREVLFEAGNLSGWHLDENGNEAELVRNIVKDVNVLLDCTHLDVAKYPVGIESRAEEVENLLNMESDKVLLVGLWGMAGIGKTTLAKAVFNAVADQFEGCAFLPNVREESANSSVGLPKLQEKLLSEVLGRKDVTVGSIARGITLIKDRLNQKKVLLLLDDISSMGQLDALAGGWDWFGNGSRILVTTRNRSLLTAHNEHIVHNVEGLPYNQALQLFSKHTFPENDRPNIAEDLIDRCLAYCASLPLALVVLGSLLRKREEPHWISTLKFLEQGPCEEIDKVLRVSFIELDLNSKKILLNIACFFKGECRREIEKAMDACGFETSLGIDRLIERSLITIVKDTTCGSSVERVEMHPLFQSMCRNIVCQGSPDEHGNRSRRRVYEGTRSVLSNGKGTNIAKDLALQSPHPKEMRFRADTLTNLKKPRRLVMGNVNYVEEPMCFPGDLPWIKWSGYSISNSLCCWPRKFKLQNSVCCRGKGIFRHSLRVALDYHSWCNRKVALSVDESRLRFPLKTVAKSATAKPLSEVFACLYRIGYRQ